LTRAPTLAGAAEQQPRPSLAAAYRPPAGTTDEMIGADGAVKPLWQPLIDRLDALGRTGVEAQFARADGYLRDAGVYYRAYGEDGSTAREWPLAHVPLLIDEGEWRAISDGLAQRAELLERVIADIYGENRLVAEGLLPPQIIAASPEYLRPLAGARPRGAFLHFLAFELGRGPDGRWWVLGDRTQAPSGAGFALESRMATARALPDLLGGMNVHRLAGFFRDLRDALFSLSGQGDAGVAILTPGQRSETYFEQAYIARYLGLMLLEGADLAVVDGRVMVRTVEGPRPLSVLWRRIDSAFMDPLELRHDSYIGAPGLVEAVRRGGATVVNAIGSGILETRALLAFLPGISRALNGADLALPHIATWWCGEARERDATLADLDRMIIGPALSTLPPFDDTAGTLLPSALGEREREELRDRVRKNGANFVAQESVTLSTMPFYAGGKLVPRPVTLRAYAMRTPAGWAVMPGGFARIGASAETSAIAMQAGGRAADVWIVSDRPVERVTLLPADSDTVNAKLAAVLPSRAADNLFWLGRYIERADGVARLLRAFHERVAERQSPAQAALRSALREIGIDAREPIPGALIASIDAAAESAGRIRDRFSPEGWLALMDLSKTVHRFSGTVAAGDDASRAMTVLLRKLAGFAGIAHENMYHALGWRFLEIGRRLERAIEMARLIALLAPPDAAAELLDLLVEIGDSVMTHRRRYKVNSGRLAAIELLALDEANPRSVLFQLAEMRTQISTLPDRDGGASPIHPPVMRETLRLYTELAISEPRAVSPERMRELSRAIGALSDLIDTAYFR
jgi:uncharacterized circularly permuted ATP-grasp superfamily protein/uncharacterized alpha-E superfamily protein